MMVRKLQDELQQTKPFVSEREEAMLAILKTADVIRRRLVLLMETHHVTAQQYNVLRILRGAGPAGLPTLSIGQRLIEETPGITRLLDRMEARGWVERVRSAKDRRVVYAKICPAGLELLEAVDPELNAHIGGLFPLLSDTGVKQLIGLLEQARAEAPEAAKTAVPGAG